MAYINNRSGTGDDISRDIEVLVVESCDCDCGASTSTSVDHIMSETVVIYKARVVDFDMWEWVKSLWTPPWHPPIPMNIKPIKSAPRITNHIIKQPGPMRRGNRI